MLPGALHKVWPSAYIFRYGPYTLPALCVYIVVIVSVVLFEVLFVALCLALPDHLRITHMLACVTLSVAPPVACPHSSYSPLHH
jgi:hypothetical protein